MLKDVIPFGLASFSWFSLAFLHTWRSAQSNVARSCSSRHRSHSFPVPPWQFFSTPSYSCRFCTHASKCLVLQCHTQPAKRLVVSDQQRFECLFDLVAWNQGVVYVRERPFLLFEPSDGGTPSVSPQNEHSSLQLGSNPWHLQQQQRICKNESKLNTVIHKVTTLSTKPPKFKQRYRRLL